MKILRIAAALYSILLLSLAFLAIPIERFLIAHGLRTFFYSSLLIFFLGLFVGMIFYHRRHLNFPRVTMLAGIAVIYWFLGHSTPYAADKMHLGTYSVLAILYRASMNRRAGWPADLLAVVLAAVFGLADETLQHFIPGRFFEWRDVFNNAAAGGLAIFSKSQITKPKHQG